MSKHRLKAIIDKILAGNATAEEIAEVANAIQQDHVRQVVEDIHGMLSHPVDREVVYDEEKWDAISTKILTSDTVEEEHTSRNKMVRLIKRLSVAAAIVAALALGIFLLQSNKSKPATQKSQPIPVLNDIAAPGKSKAVLTLSNGTEIELDKAEAGSVWREGTTGVIKMPGGDIVYDPKGPAGHEIVYNTLTVPKGSKLTSVTLADGTRVWLNNESSLRYPASFTGDERRVEVDGEAYFEVAKNAGKPFFVSGGETTIKVIGTHFNMSAYRDQPLQKITLLEGSAQVIKGAAAIELQPRQQAEVNERIHLNTNCNIDEVTAWKNGRFAFYEADIKTVMDQVARWYNLEVVITGKITEKFQVEMTRHTNVSSVLKMLEATGGVHFRLEQNKIYVMP